MIRLAIVVEGETEEEFVKSVLARHLRAHGVEVTPHLLGGNGSGRRERVWEIASAIYTAIANLV